MTQGQKRNYSRNAGTQKSNNNRAKTARPYGSNATKPGPKPTNQNTAKPKPNTNKPNQPGSKPNKPNYHQNKQRPKTNRPHQRRGNSNYQPKKPKPSPIKIEPTLKIIPVGGCEEVGRNMTIFEYGRDIIILDMGIMFPEEDMPGIDYIIPNSDYLKGREKDVRGVVFSHGHLDHIGAAPIILEKLGYPPIVGRDMTIAMLKHRQEDYQKGSTNKLKVIPIKDINAKIKLGIFNISFFQIEHSVMDAVGVVITTPSGTVIHPGDWTLEKDKNGKPSIDYSFLAKLPKPTVLMLESLGAVDVRESATTDEMHKNLTKLLTDAKGRVIVGTFSSQIERINWIISAAEKLGKKVALDGYSMKTNVEIAKKLGYIKARTDTLIDARAISKYPDHKVIILCTGAQGESNAVLSRIIEGSHRNIKVQKDDTIILSSSIIPGNERSIQKLKDNLYRKCNNVIHGKLMDIHVSGHGNATDISYMLKTIKPDYFIPVYANHYMLKEAKNIALRAGMKDNRIFVPDNGQVIVFDKTGGKMTTKKIPAHYVFVDGLGVTDNNTIVLRDRKMMCEDGMIVVIVTISSKTGELLNSPDLISRGFVYLKENKKLIEMTRQKVKKIFKDYNPDTAPDDRLIKTKIRNEIGQFLYQKTEKRPMVLPVIIEI